MSPNTKLRLPQLDALRGLAALSVFWYHAFGMLPEKPKALLFILATPLGGIFNGRSAVWLFFVLSGFVLNRKFVEMETYPRFWKSEFIVRRIFRIYPAFLVTLLLAFAFKAFVFQPAEAYSIYTEGFAKEWQASYSPSAVARVFTLIWPGIKVNINPPIWSLVEEMRISLIFPILIIAVNRWPRLISNLLFLFGSYAVGFLLPDASTVRHLPHFVLGAICARHITGIAGWLGRQHWVSRTMWFAVSFGLYGITAEITTHVNTLSQSTQFIIEQVVGLGSAGLIVFCVGCVSSNGFMGSRPMRFIGETSYSFYLSHMIFLFALSFWLLKYTGSYAATWLTVLALTYVVSYLLFHFVEMPMNRVGHNGVRWALARTPLRLFFPNGVDSKPTAIPAPAVTAPLAESTLPPLK
jgi:peptidoglycan/LPS O-acetylase OafA/YrhL